jgi:hypothetical protein
MFLFSAIAGFASLRTEMFVHEHGNDVQRSFATVFKIGRAGTLPACTYLPFLSKLYLFLLLFLAVLGEIPSRRLFFGSKNTLGFRWAANIRATTSEEKIAVVVKGVSFVGAATSVSNPTNCG